MLRRYSFSEFEKQSICSAYNYKCNVCKTDLVERDFDIDHIIPIANGGKNSIENFYEARRMTNIQICIFDFVVGRLFKLHVC